MAIDVAKKDEAQGSVSLLSGFENFLKTMMKFDKTHIVLEKFYSKNIVDSEVLAQQLLILDSTNPYDNYFADIDQNKIDLYRKFAKTTWGRLSCDSNKRIVFRPQPKAIAIKSMVKYLPQLTNWKIEIRKKESIKKPKSILRGRNLSNVSQC